MAAECQACGTELKQVGFECGACGETHCRKHRSDHPECPASDPNYTTVTPGQESTESRTRGQQLSVKQLTDPGTCSECAEALSSIAYGCEGCQEAYCREHVTDHADCRGEDPGYETLKIDRDGAEVTNVETASRSDGSTSVKQIVKHVAIPVLVWLGVPLAFPWMGAGTYTAGLFALLVGGIVRTYLGVPSWTSVLREYDK